MTYQTLPVVTGQKIDDNGLKALLDAEIANALGYTGLLSAQRQKALYYYFGEAKLELAPPESDGRSSVVSTDLADVIEWIMPALCKIFTGGDDAVKFEAQTQDSADEAEQATAYCNYVFYRQNPGFAIIHNWFKDALLEKAGIIKVYWDDAKDVKREEYKGLTLDELTLLTNDPEVAIVEQSSYADPSIASVLQALAQPPAPLQAGAPGARPQAASPEPAAPPEPPRLYDVVVTRTKKAAKIRIENVPPEEFLISRRARTMLEPGFVCHRVRKTASDLRAMGYSQAQIDNCTTDDTLMEMNQEKIERLAFDDEWPTFRETEGEDPARRVIWLHECYINVDYDGDGIAEQRRILKCGTEILENDPIDEHPFCLVTPIMMPHRVIGMSLADVLFDIQRIKTVLLRQFLDSQYLANNPRLYVDRSKGVNLDDLLMVRPGGIVRGDGPDGVSPLVVPNAGQQAIEGLQYLDEIRENRTGVTKYNQGADSQSLNKTAYGVDALLQQSNQRIELIARCFAETGVTDLFRKMRRLAHENAQQEVMLRLNNSFVAVNPRDWREEFDVTINVGLGVENKGQIMQRMMMILQAQQQGAAMGLATPKNIYEALTELTRAAGFKDVARFWHDPTQPPSNQPGESMPQQPNPEIVKAQMDAQVAAQVAQIKAQADQQSQQARAQADMAIEQQKMQLNAQMEAMRTKYDLQMDAMRHMMEQQQQSQTARLNAMTQIEVARIKQGLGDGTGIVAAELAQTGTPNAADQQTHAMLGQVAQHLQNLHQLLATPNEIVRDHTGRAVGVRKATLQ